MSRILIIDDEEGMRDELSERVESMGHDPVVAECVDNAWKLLEEEAFDCVLLDLAIPVKFEGVARVDHGKNLLQRIAASPSYPPVIVVTANHKSGHKVGIECMELGASSFVSKDFDEDPVEPKIRKVLDRQTTPRRAKAKADEEFAGGVLILHEDGIELNSQIVGGVKGNASIRRVIEILSEKKDGIYRKCSAKTLAEAIDNQIPPPSIICAIMDFRNSCKEKLGCGKNDVIRTCPGGGYQLADRIEVRIGREDLPKAGIESDKVKLLNQIKKKQARTRRQLSDACGVPQMRVKRALSALEDEKKIRHEGSGSSVQYFLQTAKQPQ